MNRVTVSIFPRYILVVILLFLCGLAFGQQYNFRSYSLEQGLPQSQVNALIKDQKGNLWVGTNGGGLCRFNGKEFQTFTKKQGLPDNVITSLHQDQLGRIWIGTTKGIAAYDGNSFKHYYQPTGDKNGFYYWIDSDEQNRVWVLGVENQGVNQLLYLEDDRFHNLIPLYPELSDNNFITGGMIDENQNLLISTKNGLFQFDGSRLQLSGLEDLFPEEYTVQIGFRDRENRLLIAAGVFPKITELYEYHLGELTEVDLPPGYQLNQLKAPFEDSNGNLWIPVVDDGVMRVSYDEQRNPSYMTFNRSNGLPINQINSILEDREGNIWFGSDGGGLIKFSSEKFVALNLDDGLSSELIWSISQDQAGDYWFGSVDGAIIKYDGNEITNVAVSENSQIGFVRKFLPLESGNILIGSNKGLWEYDGKDFAKVNQAYRLDESATIADMIRDGNDFLFSVPGMGVGRFNGEQTVFINTESDSIVGNHIDHLMMDSKGNLWMATKSMGVTKYQGQPLSQLEPKDQGGGPRVQNFNSSNGLNNDYILQIAEDKIGNLWFASYGGGLNIYDGSDFWYLDMESGLTSDNIYSVIADDEGNIWAGTQNGVDKITLDQNGSVLSIINYDKYDGFTGIEANGMANFKDGDGNLWFGTIKGVMRYKPSADQTNPVPPVTNITDLKLFFKHVDWNQESYQKYLSGVQSWNKLPQDLSLPYDMNHVTFNFEALSFQVPEKVKYQWRLVGLDKEWTPETSKTEAVYPNLSPGVYTFQVKASNNDGVWNETPSSFSFVVQPPWWGTWWFRILLVMAVVGLVTGIYKWRTHSIKKKQIELEKMVKQKTKEVVKQKDEILVKSRKLKESYDNLELLSEVGKSIASNLSVSKIIDTVYENVNDLMKAEVFWIGIYRKDKDAIEFQGGIEAGKKLVNFCCSLSEDNRLAVWCFKNKQEVFINDYSKQYKDYTDKKLDAIAGEPTKSIIYVPLISHGEAIGVLSVQSYEKNAYGEHHLSLIRNIAVHTKIALENASAYEKITEQSMDLLHQKQQIEHKNQELMELNKEKNHLIGIVAHDLRNPLTSALTIGGLLKSGEELSEEQKEYTVHMVNAMERMNNMVNRILDIKAIESKSIELNLQRTNFADVLQEVCGSFKDALDKKKLEFQLSQEHPDPVAMVDRNYLTQIFENLVSNAIKFSPPNRKISVDILQNNGQIITEITDQGPGLTEEDLPKLFQKYQKLSAKPTAGEQSTGLGLSIVKKYVEAMDGRVWAESQPGEGATFKVEFNVDH